MDSKIEYSFEKKYKLKAQSPMLHFQHDQYGATLRATEVKPKLDAFLKKKLDSIPNEWFVGNSNALNYKLHFEGVGFKGISDPPKIYYGNRGDNKKIKAIKQDCLMTVVCFEDTLMSEIDKYIGEFFIVHNFGRMQSKGFGSFTVQDIQYTVNEIGRLLSAHAGSRGFFYINGYNLKNTDEMFKLMFDNIATLCVIMKSGFNFGTSYHRSYLFKYFIDKGIGNEKAYLKKEKVVPSVVHPYNRNKKFPEQTFRDYKYTRALLGIGEQLEYIAGFEDEKDDRGKFPIIGKEKISIKNEDFDRLASPIFFKIIGNVIYIVAKRINNKIFGKPFEFKNKITRASETVYVPDSFDIDDFMEYFVKKYNVDSKQTDKKGNPVRYSIFKDIKYQEAKKGDECT